MIKIVLTGPKNAPMVVCDQCGLPIRDCREGNTEWKMSHKGVLVEDGKVYFTHKKCCRQFEAVNKGDYLWMSSELGAWLTYLMHNAKANTKEVRENAARLEEI